VKSAKSSEVSEEQQSHLKSSEVIEEQRSAAKSSEEE